MNECLCKVRIRIHSRNYKFAIRSGSFAKKLFLAGIGSGLGVTIMMCS